MQIDTNGKLTLRHNSRLHHIGLGRRHAGTPVLCWSTTCTSAWSSDQFRHHDQRQQRGYLEQQAWQFH